MNYAYISLLMVILRRNIRKEGPEWQKIADETMARLLTRYSAVESNCEGNIEEKHIRKKRPGWWEYSWK